MEMQALMAVRKASAHPHEAGVWFQQIEQAARRDQLAELGSFATLDAKLCDAIAAVLPPALAKRVAVLHAAQLSCNGCMLSGRQVVHALYDHFAVGPVQDGLLAAWSA